MNSPRSQPTISTGSGPLRRRGAVPGFLRLGKLVAVHTPVTPSTGTSGSASGSAGIQVTDQRGTVLSFDRPVTRVVTIPMPAASLLVAVDQGASHLAGMHNASWVAMRDGVMGTMYPEALNVPHDIATTDFTPNVESIRALNPDVVVQWSDAQLTAPLEQAGMKVLGITNYRDAAGCGT